MKKLLLIVLFIAVNAIAIQAQDRIYKKNGEIINCKVIEIDANYIKFKQPKINPDVTINIPKSKVSKIVYSNGDIFSFDEPVNTQSVYDSEAEVTEQAPNMDDFLKNNKKNAIKIGFFSPLTGHLSFGYERSLGAQRSVEVGLGIIGVGGTFNPINMFFFIPNKDLNTYQDPKGAFIRIGYKFIRNPNDYRIPHLLKGSYFKPEITYTFFNSTTKLYYDNPKPGEDIYTFVTTNHNVYAFMLNIGKQWIFENIFLIDINFGLGYGFGLGDSGSFVFSHIQGGNSFPISLSAGFRFGFLL
jgi:hypothetical protein